MATPAAQPSQSSEDWQTTKETVRDRTAFLFNNSLLSDIKFVVADTQDTSDSDSKDESNNDSKQESNNDSKQEFNNESKQESISDSRDVSDDSRQVRVPAHKFVLAISSPVFQAMLYGQMAEKGEEVELPDTDSHTLLEFLRFVYCDEVNLTADNVFAVMYLADKYIVPCLAAKCWSFIDENTTACVKSDRAVSTLSNVTLVSLLKRDSLRTKELPLFEAVKNWAEAKCEEKGLEPTGEAMREILGEAVDFIRFPTMSQQDFAEQVVPSGILTDKEALEMHQYFFRRILTPNTRFSSRYRDGIASVSTLRECSLYTCMEVDQKKSVQLRNESLKLMVEHKDIHLKGVRLLVSKTEKQYFSAVVLLLDKNGGTLAEKKGSFPVVKLNILNPFYGFDVLFNVPVLIWKSSKYTLEVTIRGRCVFPMSKEPLAVVKQDDFYFMFEGNSHQIYQLLFHTLN